MRATIALLALVGACTESGEDAGADDDASPGVDAGSAGDAAPAGDAVVGPDSGMAYCAQESAFLAQPQRCTADSECVIAGGCGGTFGFVAVHEENRARAQAFYDYRGCTTQFDGPTYRAVCEEGLCRTRRDGRYCGVPSDAGSSGCGPGMEMYRVIGSDAGEPFGECEKRCLGATDSSCGPDSACKQVKVSSAGSELRAIDVWLCRPPTP